MSRFLPDGTQAYVAVSCFRQVGFTVEFETWEQFSKRLRKSGPTSVAEELKEEGFDCILGGIDLSLKCVGFSGVMRFQH